MLEHRWRKEETNLGTLGWSSRLSRAGGACMSAYQCAPRSDLGTASIGLTAAGLLAWPRLSEKVHRPHHATATGLDACFPLQDGEREALCCHIIGNIRPAACCLAIRTVRLSFLLPALHQTHGGRRRVVHLELKAEIWFDDATGPHLVLPLWLWLDCWRQPSALF